MDLWLIGSDISHKAIETSTQNIDFCDFDSMYNAGMIPSHEKPLISNPMMLQSHWPHEKGEGIIPINRKS